MKILIIHNSYKERGGEDEVVESEIKLLRGHGHEVVEYRRSNKEVENFSFLRRYCVLQREILWSQDSYNRVKVLIDREKPDIAHTHNVLLLISPSVYYALNEGNIPIIQTLHNYRLICPKGILYRNSKICEKCLGGNFLYSIIYKCWRNSFLLSLSLARTLSKHFSRKAFRDMISAYIVLSEFSREEFIKAGLPSEKIFVKPNFVDIHTVKERHNFEDFVLFIGRLVDYKGVLILVDAFEQLGNYHLKIIGDGPLFDELKKRVEKTGNIDLLGRLSNAETQDYIKRAAFVVLPSDCYESTPRVVIESLSCGVPILVSDRAFKGGFVEEENIGLEFKAGDSNSLAIKVKYFMENKQLLREMGKDAFRVYREKYTPESNYKLLIEIYNRAIELNKINSLRIS